MAENNNQGGQKRNSLIYKIIGVAVLAVVVILLIVLGSSGKKTDDSSSQENANSNPDTALHVVQPVKSGDYEYTFQGIKWIFDTESPEVIGTNQTWVKFEFADFTRNGSAIAFGKPYKLGVHPGTCKQLDFIDTSSETGIPFAYAECVGGGVTHDFVVLQEKENVVVKMNEKKDGKESGWQEWYKINVTEIVR